MQHTVSDNAPQPSDLEKAQRYRAELAATLVRLEWDLQSLHFHLPRYDQKTMRAVEAEILGVRRRMVTLAEESQRESLGPARPAQPPAGQAGGERWWPQIGAFIIVLIVVLVTQYILPGRVQSAVPTNTLAAPGVSPQSAVPVDRGVLMTGSIGAGTVSAGNLTPTASTSVNRPLRALQLVDTIETGQSLCDLAVDNTGEHVYVTDSGANQLRVISSSTHKLFRSFDLKGSPCSLALDEAGHTVYVPVWRFDPNGKRQASEMNIVDLVTGGINRIKADYFPAGLFFNARTRVLFATNTTSPTLLIIDPATRAVTTSIPVGTDISNITMSTANDNLYLTSTSDNQLLIYNTARKAVINRVAVGQGPWGVAGDPRTGVLAVSNELSDTVTIIDSRTGLVARTLRVGNHPRGLVYGDTCRCYYVLNVGDRTVSTVQEDDGQSLQSAPLPGQENLGGLAVATATGQLFVVSTHHIYVLQELP